MAQGQLAQAKGSPPGAATSLPASPGSIIDFTA
jgi:hypothetical protein